MTTNNRKGTLNLSALRELVSERDLAILTLIRAHKFLTTKQIQRLLFWNHATSSAGIRATVRVLTRLESHVLIYKLARQVGGLHAGSASYIWGIDDAGDRLLRAQLSNTKTTRSRAFEPSPLFLAHTLAIAETRVLLEEAAHCRQLELLSVATEPSNWRSFIGKSGSEQLLKPDLHAVTASDAFEDHWFIEIDNGTESLPTLINKCLTYQRYFETGTEQASTGVFPVVVWVISQARRRRRLDEAIESDRRLDGRLFRSADITEYLSMARNHDDDEDSTDEGEVPGMALASALD